MSTTVSSLSALVPTKPFLFAYSIPLLLISIPHTFAGTFLTLDRSRSFPSNAASTSIPGSFDGAKSKSRLNLPLHGGVGGLASGYIFGVSLSTFLSVLIPAISSSSNLSSGSFMAVWILSCIPLTILGGRYRYCARMFAAVSGGSLLGLGISVILHPPLLPRQVLIVLLGVSLPILTLLFSFPRLFHLLRPALRVATASSGSFCLILSIALLSHISAWADVWERLWLRDGEGWGSSKEKGLSAAFCILLCIGVITDYALKRWLGECPDEKWDKYLAQYSANLPNDASRAGTFRPLGSGSIWTRFFGSSSQQSKKDILFPSTDSHTRNSLTKDSGALLENGDYKEDWIKLPLSDPHLSYDDLPSPPTFLKKMRSQSTKFKVHKKKGYRGNAVPGRKRPIKFGEDLSSDSSEDHSDHVGRPWLKQKSSMASSSPTLVDEVAHERISPKQIKPKTVFGLDEVPDYSDYEEDLGKPNSMPGSKERDTGWSFRFIQSTSSQDGSHTDRSMSQRGASFAPPIGAVPATPSLIKALDRISTAQRDAFGSSGTETPVSTLSLSHAGVKTSTSKVDGLPMVDELDGGDEDAEDMRHRRPGWDEFWKEVRHKAQN